MDQKRSDYANGDSAGFWQAAAEERLELQACRACGHIQFPPRYQCASCWSADIEATESSGRGIVESVTVVQRAPLPQFRGREPYAVVAVRLDDGPRMITNLVGDGALEAAIGDAVSVCFEADHNGNVLPQFRLV